MRVQSYAKPLFFAATQLGGRSLSVFGQLECIEGPPYTFIQKIVGQSKVFQSEFDFLGDCLSEELVARVLENYSQLF